jgi:phage-related tail protein
MKGATMTSTERVTGTRDEHFNLTSVLYHALQEAETLQQYIDDAKQAGDSEVAEFFREMRDTDQQRIGRAKQLLAARLEQAIS